MKNQFASSPKLRAMVQLVLVLLALAGPCMLAEAQELSQPTTASTSQETFDAASPSASVKRFADVLAERKLGPIVEFFDTSTPARATRAAVIADSMLANMHLFIALKDRHGLDQALVFRKSGGFYVPDDYRAMEQAEWHIENDSAWCVPKVFGEQRVRLVRLGGKWRFEIPVDDRANNPQAERSMLDVYEKITRIINRVADDVQSGKVQSLEDAQKILDSEINSVGFGSSSIR